MTTAHSRSMRRLPHARQAGFTLVELITVILILGVLAAVAIPRYADLQGKARAAKVAAVAGSIKAASGLVKAAAMANGKSCADGTTLSQTMEGTSIALNYCYPQALGSFTTGILAAANVASSDNWVIDSTNGGAAAVGSLLQINLGDAATVGSTCSVSYTSPSAANTQPTISATTSGC